MFYCHYMELKCLPCFQVCRSECRKAGKVSTKCPGPTRSFDAPTRMKARDPVRHTSQGRLSLSISLGRLRRFGIASPNLVLMAIFVLYIRRETVEAASHTSSRPLRGYGVRNLRVSWFANVKHNTRRGSDPGAGKGGKQAAF